MQGGGAHGAFTWGVLDRLLDEEDIEVAAITGTSAGALNGAAFKSGMVHAGRDGARASLNGLWKRMGAVGDMRLANWMQAIEPAQIAQAMEYSLPFSVATRGRGWFRPMPMDRSISNPLEPVVDRFNFDEICADEGPRLFVCATCVRSGKIRVFTGEVSTDAILASACLPNLFKAVEIFDPKTRSDRGVLGWWLYR